MQEDKSENKEKNTSVNEDNIANTLFEHTTLPPHLSRRAPRAPKINNDYLVYTRRLGAILLIVLALGAGFLGGWLGSQSHINQVDSSIVTSGKQTVISTQSQLIHKIASSVGQSVVSIVASQSTPTSSSSSLNQLFGFGFGGGSNSGTTSKDAGTGIILTANGLIITNRHVVPAGTTSVSVTLSDGTTYNNVKVVGRTSPSDSLDIAFLQIQNLNGRKLVPATIGDSAQMKVGDQVVAIGNALGQFQNTVTSGIISGFGRSVQASSSTGSTSENLTDLFQTDAAINEGNSGGPLVNLSGQVIGINTAIASNSQNIGFSIPINDVIGLIKSVEQTGKLQQPYLGVIYVPITPQLQQQYSLSVSNGAYIPPAGIIGQSPIISGGPADKAGLKAGDIITKVDGRSINEKTSLTEIIDQDNVGQNVTLTVIRNGKTITLHAKLGIAPTS